VSEAPAVNWDDLMPYGRVVFYEGDDPESFAQEVHEEFGIDVTAPAPANWEYQPDWEGAGSFFIPPGQVQAVYGSRRWPLGS